MAGRNNRSGLRVLWMPGRKKHGQQKKDKVYRSHSRSQDRSPASPYSRRKHQEDPILSSMAADPAAPISAPVGVAGSTVLTSKQLIPNEENLSDSELVQTSVVVEPEQQNGNRNADKIENLCPKALNQMNNKPGSKESLERKRQEEAIEMVEDPSMSTININDDQVLMNQTNNNTNNGYVDNIDGILAKTKKKKRKNKKNKQKNAETEDGCGIKCLSVALQCCECTII